MYQKAGSLTTWNIFFKFHVLFRKSVFVFSSFVVFLSSHSVKFEIIFQADFETQSTKSRWHVHIKDFFVCNREKYQLKFKILDVSSLFFKY